MLFQHTAARRRLPEKRPFLDTREEVSTHSRPKAAASESRHNSSARIVSTHSRPKAAARFRLEYKSNCYSFNTQPPEGGCVYLTLTVLSLCGFNTQPPEGGCATGIVETFNLVTFQHTAARRRLQNFLDYSTIQQLVSTHSRPKAAAF